MSPEDGIQKLDVLLRHSKYAEYQVLYTFDVQKRTKIWNDGTLRLFKMNKKLILYDDDKVLVYEDFWRKYERFKDQKTLKFDVIWITIDSLLGIYERDISGQFHQKNAHDVNTVAHLISKSGGSCPSKIPRTPVSNKHSGHRIETQVKDLKRSNQKRHQIGLHDSKGKFKSPLIHSHSKRAIFQSPRSPVPGSHRINNTSSVLKPKASHKSMKRPNLHIDRTFETPVLDMKQLLTPPLSNFAKDTMDSQCDSTFSEIQTPLKNYDTGRVEFPDCFKKLCEFGSEKVDVYDSDSQGNNDELSEPDEEKHDEPTKKHSQGSIFRRLELGEKNAEQVVTETWGRRNKTSSQGTKKALVMSRRLLAKQ